MGLEPTTLRDLLIIISPWSTNPARNKLDCVGTIPWIHDEFRFFQKSAVLLIIISSFAFVSASQPIKINQSLVYIKRNIFIPKVRTCWFCISALHKAAEKFTRKPRVRAELFYWIISPWSAKPARNKLDCVGKIPWKHDEFRFFQKPAVLLIIISSFAFVSAISP